ncbi:MAG: C1 family peptidase, partial [Prevotellamassilia sp.]|nr:C1 family peptidase [Prevotellamassilia sp.]
MKKFLTLALAALAMGATAQEKKDSVVYEVIKENAITPIKDQNQSGTCWSYSAFAFFESEILRLGKGEVDLCESFLVYNTYMDRADKAIRTHGDASFSQGGSFYDAIYCLKNYGLVPQSAMPAPGTPYGDSLFNANQLDAVTTAYVEALAKGKLKKINPVWRKDLNA